VADGERPVNNIFTFFYLKELLLLLVECYDCPCDEEHCGIFNAVDNKNKKVAILKP